MRKSKQLRKVVFLAAHPQCIFCGGNTASSEPDHVPSRQLFDGRHAPEGYEFPACSKCNRATKDVEQIIATLSRIYPNAATDAQRLEMKNGIKAVANNYKQILLEMRPSANQVRRFLRAHGIRKDPNIATSQYRLLSAEGPETQLALGAFSRKLFTALHYKHARKIIPPTGGVAWTFYPNVALATESISQSIFDLLQQVPILKRGMTNLESQFTYRFACSDTGEVATYLAIFRFSFAILGHVQMDAAMFPVEVANRVVRPLHWN